MRGARRYTVAVALFRLGLLPLGGLGGYAVGRLLAARSLGSPASAAVNTVYLVAAGLLLAFLLGPPLARAVSTWGGRLRARLARLDPRRVAAASAGLLAALLLGVLLGSALAGAPLYTWDVSLLVTLTLGVLCVAFALRNAQVFGGLSWHAPPARRGAKVLDTNVIIDGRVVGLARSGLLEGELIVPAFVLRELQFLADHGEAQRRARGKRGLGVLEELRALAPLSVLEWDAPELPDVDDKLVRLARELGAGLITNDANLSKVAALHGVRTLSIHDAAVALRPTLAAGESLEITVSKAGQQAGQGVGYLDDGTMIVVEDGLKYKGKSVRVLVLSNVQTSVGRMVFARAEGARG